MRWAIIIGGVVANVIVWDGVTPWAEPVGSTLVNIDAQPSVDIGWMYAGGVFSAPPAQ